MEIENKCPLCDKGKIRPTKEFLFWECDKCNYRFVIQVSATRLINKKPKK